MRKPALIIATCLFALSGMGCLTETSAKVVEALTARNLTLFRVDVFKRPPRRVERIPYTPPTPSTPVTGLQCATDCP